jgi:hypothetical protein
MNHEVEAYEGEPKSLREKVALYDKIFLHSFAADKVGNIYFICGEGGEKDHNNLPDSIHICPAFGVDWFQVYKKTDQTFGPEW